MGSWFIITVAIVSVQCGTSQATQAVCSPCPFQWMENQNYCYRYFPENLSYNEAEMFCKQFSHTGHVAELATVTNPGELAFIINYLDKVFANVTPAEVPINVWLRNNTENIPEVDLILHRTLGPMESHVASCDSVAVSGDWYQLGGNTSLIEIVPAPDVVDHACAVYAKSGSYLDLGDFKGTCISDPDLCENMTWSLWLKIDTSSGFTGERYYISSGGQTGYARGIAFLFVGNMFKYYVRTSDSLKIKTFIPAKIPKNIWFHLILSADIDAVQLYVNGVSVQMDEGSKGVGAVRDHCTKFCLGMGNSCHITNAMDPRVLGGSAAYSDLTVFDNLLTEQQRENIYVCGSYDWDLKVRSLIMKSDLEYECTASDSAGPIITWSLYHKQTSSWENLDTSVDVYAIQSMNVSTCVVRSTLVMSSSQVSPMAIACTAQAGSNNASVFIYKGHEMMFGFSDQRHTGISLLAEGSLVHYTHKHGYQQDGSSTVGQPKYPFLCKIPDKMH